VYSPRDGGATVQYALIQEVEEVPNLCSAAGVRERKVLGTTLQRES
jgi:hypothetical protein